MDTEKIAEVMDKLWNTAGKLPTEKQLRLIWIMISALFSDLKQLEKYQDAQLKAIAQYLEAVSKADDEALHDQSKISEQLITEFLGTAKEPAQ